ncbi:antibiotic biosynthesis monooxygenase [Roseateles cavernae]|uniref:antibiotic biosynthesis monooxygenase n=1 Tax=Roseateles cavernae TaxID=3153578 RepID=UPI0032E3EDC6
MSHATPSADSRYRIDKFIVPSSALSSFLKQIERIDAELSTLPGCEQHLVLIQEPDVAAEVFHVMTLVEWTSPAHLIAAKTHMRQRYRRDGFEPAAFIQELGVRADLGDYRRAELAG